MIAYFLLIWMSLTSLAEPSNLFVIYGEDDREEISNISDPQVQKLARSTLALVESKNLRLQKNGQILIKGKGYGSTLKLCSTERFYAQKMFAFCSGVLVEPDVLLTAGHCIDDLEDCKSTSFIMDLRQEDWDEKMLIEPRQVRRCHRLLKRSMRKDGLDFALVQLDSPITDREPVRWMTDSGPSSPRLYMIGHPWGLTQKYSGNGHVVQTFKHKLITDLDAASGNSGSPVFDEYTGLLVGILTEGEDDLVKAPKKGCKMAKRCKSGDCLGETVLKIQTVIDNL